MSSGPFPANSSRFVLIDDTDPDIVYAASGPPWIPDKSSASSGAIYQTSHILIAGPGNFSYTYNGSFIAAYFLPGPPASSVNCSVDGAALNVSLTSGETGFSPGSFYCQTPPSKSGSEADGTHKLMVSAIALQDPIALDYMLYTPRKDDNPSGDVAYVTTNASTNPYTGVPNKYLGTMTPGSSMDFDFFGYSLGLYTDFDANSDLYLSNASYAVDGQAQITFSINDPVNLRTPFLDMQLFLQTPRYSLGWHHFHIEFQGEDDKFLDVEKIIVQNTTNPPVNLVPFPSITSSSASNTSASPSTSSLSAFTPSQHASNHLGLIIGLTIGALAALSFITSCLFYRRRRMRGSEAGGAVLVRPFIIPSTLQIGPAKLRNISGNAHNGLGVGSGRTKAIREGRQESQARQGMSTTSTMERHQSQAQRVIVHIDGGHPPIESAAETEIVELPPAYLSVRPSRSSSEAQPALHPSNATEGIHIREKI